MSSPRVLGFLRKVRFNRASAVFYLDDQGAAIALKRADRAFPVLSRFGLGYHMGFAAFAGVWRTTALNPFETRMTLDYLISIGKIILFDLVLSGDNAVVIGLAAHRLPPVQRRKAMFWGCALAVGLRIGLTLIVAHLLGIPGLRFTGAVLLAWIACKLMLEEVQAHADPNAAPTSLFKAVQRIAMADFIMSLDNVLAIASASGDDWTRIIFGLLLSISMLLALSAVITEMMSRYRWIAYAGAAVLAWTAADMMVEDLEAFFTAGYVSGFPEFPKWGVWALRIGLVTLCMTINYWLPGARPAPPSALQAEAESGPDADAPLEQIAEH